MNDVDKTQKELTDVQIRIMDCIQANHDMFKEMSQKTIKDLNQDASFVS